MLANDIPIMRMELVDASSIKQVNEYGDYSFPVAHSLFFEFAGAKSAVEAQAVLVKEIMEELGCEHWDVAEGTKERNEIWKARHQMAYAFQASKRKTIFWYRHLCSNFQTPGISPLCKRVIGGNWLRRRNFGSCR